MIRVGFVGCGQRAWHHARVLRDFEGELETQFTAFYDIAPAKSALLANKFGGEAFSSLDKFLKGAEVDALWICLPPRPVGSTVNAALSHGIAVCLEPPFGAHIQTANSILAASKRANSPLLVSSPWRYSENFERLRKILGAKGAPPISSVSGFWSADLPRTAWRRDEKNGGIWLEAGWELLDLTRALCGTPRRILGASDGHEVRKQFPDFRGPDSASLIMIWDGGTIGNLSVSRVGQPFWRLEIMRSDGVFRWANGILEIERGRQIERFVETNNKLAQQNYAFLRFVTVGKRLENRTPFVEALKTQKLALSAQKTSQRGKVI